MTGYAVSSGSYRKLDSAALNQVAAKRRQSCLQNGGHFSHRSPFSERSRSRATSAPGLSRKTRSGRGTALFSRASQRRRPNRRSRYKNRLMKSRYSIRGLSGERPTA
jgi:hypothetical protein